MNYTSGLWCRHAGFKRPSTSFLLTGGEVCAQPQQSVCRLDQALQTTFTDPQSLKVISSLVVPQLNQLCLHLCRNPNGFRTLVGRQVDHFGAVSVSLCQIFFTHIGGIDDRLGGQQAKGLDHQCLLLAQLNRTGRTTVLQHGLNPLQGRIFLLRFLAGAHLLLQSLSSLLDLRQIRQTELQIDHLCITGRSNGTGHMDDVVILKAADHMNNRIHLADVGQELVSETFSLACSLHQSGDIDEFHPCGNGVEAAAELGELIKALIRYGHRADVRLDGAERKVGGLRLSVGHQSVEQGGLAHIGQADNSGFEHGAESTGQRRDCCEVLWAHAADPATP